jgi:hypothetical protein
MKYRQIVFAKRVAPDKHLFRQFYYPVEDRDGKMIPAGPMREETHMLTPSELMGSIDEYCGGGDGPPLPPDLPTLEGWEPVSVLPLPDNYVPQSEEVIDEGRRRATEYLKGMLGND